MWARRTRRDPWKGLAAGLMGGLVASWTMNQFQAGWSKASQKLKKQESKAQSQEQTQGDSEDATQKAAAQVSRAVLHRELTREQKKKLGPVVHYAFGTAMGGLYGALAELTPYAKTGFGTMYGAVLFAGADEAGLPVLRLAKPPTEYPLSSHAYALASHVVYGATVEGVRRTVRKVWR